MTEPTPTAPPGPNPLAVGAGLVAVIAALVGLLVVAGHDGTEVATTATSSTSTTTAPAPQGVRESGVIPITAEDMRNVEVALFGDQEVALVRLDGTEVGRGALAGLYTNFPDRGVDVLEAEGGVVLTEAPALDDPVPGCGAVHGGGGVRVAVCGPEPQTDEIRLVAADGAFRVLSGPVADAGHWRFALPSPDGQWILAQWSGECEVPEAFVFAMPSGARHAAVNGGVASTAIGWAPDGRAIVGLPSAACGAGFEQPGTYLVEPASHRLQRIHGYANGALFTGFFAYRANRLERVMFRAGRDLGLQSCCGQPSHGGGDAEDGFVFDGHDIAVHAVPFEELGFYDPPEADQLDFDCGRARYALTDKGPSGSVDPHAPDRALLERAAHRLVPGLYCTPGPFR